MKRKGQIKGVSHQRCSRHWWASWQTNPDKETSSGQKATRSETRDVMRNQLRGNSCWLQAEQGDLGSGEECRRAERRKVNLLKNLKEKRAGDASQQVAVRGRCQGLNTTREKTKCLRVNWNFNTEYILFIGVNSLQWAGCSLGNDTWGFVWDNQEVLYLNCTVITESLGSEQMKFHLSFQHNSGICINFYLPVYSNFFKLDLTLHRTHLANHDDRFSSGLGPVVTAQRADPDSHVAKQNIRG